MSVSAFYECSSQVLQEAVPSSEECKTNTSPGLWKIVRSPRLSANHADGGLGGHRPFVWRKAVSE